MDNDQQNHWVKRDALVSDKTTNTLLAILVLFKPSLPSWWQMCFFDDRPRHTSCDGPRGEMTRWHVDFLFCKFILVWSGHDNDLTGLETPDIRTRTTTIYIYTHIIRMFIQLKQILGICHILENSLEAEDFNLQSAWMSWFPSQLIHDYENCCIPEIPRAFWCWLDTLHSFLVAHLLNLFDSHFCSF